MRLTRYTKLKGDWGRKVERFDNTNQRGNGMTRLQGLEDFKDDLGRLRNFLNKCGRDAPINLIDPDQELYGFGVSVCEALVWVTAAIEKDEEAGAEAIDDNENLYKVGQ